MDNRLSLFIVIVYFHAGSVRVEDTKNRLKWKTVIRCGNPWKGKSHEEKKKIIIVYFQ